MNAIEKLKQVTQHRSWHGITNDKLAQKMAAKDKVLLFNGKMSYEKASKWLEQLGYKKVSEEIWEKA